MSGGRLFIAVWQNDGRGGEDFNVGRISTSEALELAGILSGRWTPPTLGAGLAFLASSFFRNTELLEYTSHTLRLA